MRTGRELTPEERKEIDKEIHQEAFPIAWKAGKEAEARGEDSREAYIQAYQTIRWIVWKIFGITPAQLLHPKSDCN